MCGVCGGVVETGIIASMFYWVVSFSGICWLCIKQKIFKKHKKDCDCKCHGEDNAT